MSTVVTSKEKILSASKRLVKEHGWAGVSIRSVAAACGISIGSVYTYYDSKTSLVSDTVESIWREIFHQSDDGEAFKDVQSCVIWMYDRMRRGSVAYPGFLTLHSAGFMHEAQPDGKFRMQKTWLHIVDGFKTVIRHDPSVRPDAFTERFTVEQFANVLLSLMLSAMLRGDYDPAPVLEIVRRTLYAC
ncbi:TetR/AcrR family transcriptional regulator [Olsenella massiliensis]|uniref:TetR/AcrR family transcriptional regulator n=1 Tax=Olsenella massiliensis TaxID=1622075 RepID=UPI00071E525E|nr:TetR/AcrR family transcriptional regulator [Olsenella massiliensis]